MKKLLVILAMALGLSLTGGDVLAEWDYSPGKFRNDGTIGKKYQIRQTNSGEYRSTDLSGNVDFYVPDDRVVYITSYDQLSTLSGAGSGQSYYQAAPGKIYLVDPYAIQESANAALGYDVGGTTPFLAYAGISIFLVDASIYNGPAYDVTVGMVVTGATGYDHLKTGATIVTVWPFPGTAGLTLYGASSQNYAVAYRSGNTPQTLLTEYTASGTMTNINVGSGVSHWEINLPGEMAVYGFEDSSVSVYVKKKHVKN